MILKFKINCLVEFQHCIKIPFYFVFNSITNLQFLLLLQKGINLRVEWIDFCLTVLESPKLTKITDVFNYSDIIFERFL